MEKGGESSTSNHKNIHPVYTVTNIQSKVRTLDGTKITYNTWVRLFTNHARGDKVLAHIDGTQPPAKTYPNYESWSEIDSIVLQWIYSTISDDILVRILETDSTADKAWNKIKDIYTNNKGARASALEYEFITLTLKSMPSLETYCQRLKELGDQMTDVDSPVDERRLIMQLVRGLPAEYDTTASYITQNQPTCDAACGMLQLERHRQTLRENTTPPQPVVAAVQSDTPPTRRYNNPPPNRKNSRAGNNRRQFQPDNRGRGQALRQQRPSNSNKSGHMPFL